jgi:CheY-like chemotaxis protein
LLLLEPQADPMSVDRLAGSRSTTCIAPSERAPIGQHVLLVEDDPAVRKATCMLLQTEGYQVSVASSLREALEKAGGSVPIDLLVTDYHLHGTETGIQVIAALRKALDRDLKAVLLTGDSGPVVDNLCCDAHSCIVNKPVDAKVLFRVMRSLLVI